MKYRILGRTGLSASIISLGCGGFSRIGQSTGKSAGQSVSIVGKALENGINLIDTAEAYGTEELVGQAIRGWPRAKIILSTKCSLYLNEKLKTGSQLEASLEASLRRLQTDYIDIYHLHAVKLDDYEYVCQELVPAMQKMKSQGKIRFTGITEGFASDTSHKALQRAVNDDFWDVMMVGFNLLNQSARSRVIQPALDRGIAILDMFAVRRALINPEHLAKALHELVEAELVDAGLVDLDAPLADIMKNSNCSSLTELAYRFCGSEPGIHSILSGTGNIDHLLANIRDINKGPLPDDQRLLLAEMFARVDTVSGQ